MKRLLFFLSLMAALIVLSQCDPNISERTPEPGQADFSNYVAVGNSLTAGYSDDALHREGQVNSFAAIAGEQMQQAGGGDFFQPLVNPGVGSNARGEAKLVLQPTVGPDGEPTLAPTRAADQGQDIFRRQQTGPFNNVGVPGARSYHLVTPGYGNTDAGAGNYNPFFARFASAPDATVLGDAMLAEPTFFTLWIGNNDVLGYATSGGAGDPEGGMGANDITPDTLFNQSVQAIVGTLASSAGEGVILNIPDVTNIPFFTTVPWNGLVLSAEQAQGLRMGYQAQGINVDDVDGLDFTEGANGFVIQDPEHPAGIRNAVAGEYILLSIPQDSLAAGWGSMTPIAEPFTLREPQVDHIAQATQEFNAVLQAMAGQFGLAFLDADAVLETAANQGLVYDAVRLTTEFVQGGMFSLDGVHLTPRGSAVVANKVIETINREYGATLSPVNISAYEGVRFP